MQRLIFALAGLLLAGLPANAQRLDRTVLPHHYALTVAPDFGDDTFSGEVRIEVSVQEPTRVIELHALELELDEAVIAAGGAEQAAAVTLDPERQTARLEVATSLAPGPATLRIAYRGRLNPDLRGFYLGVAGEGEKYAASQMEATDARRAFPCFDEPWMKATFAVSVVVGDGHTAISNGALIGETAGPEPGQRTLRFATTPRMSTYLVALIVGRFDCLEDEHGGVPLRICARPERVRFGGFALDATKAILDYLTDYFDYPYPFGKLDQIAVPDFSAGAMENTAAALYRETALLIDPERSSPTQQRRVAGVIAHEIAHMWFGDLVTMEWWDDLWLNEGFATFLGDKAVASWKPEWELGLAAAASSDRPLATDVLSATRQIRQQASTPEEIVALFDGIAYQKASAVLRTVETLIGDESMQRGIAAYIRRHAYGNTTAEDFYDALSAAAEHDVAAVMRSYVNQPGVPLVDVAVRCEEGATVVSLSQQRFFTDRSKLGSAPEQLWTIPVCFGERDCVLLTKAAHEARLEGCRDDAFANWEGRGYYLTAHRGSVVDAIDERSAAERLVLLRDQWYLATVGRVDVGDYLDLVAAIAPAERERRVVDQVLEALEQIERDLVAEADRAALHAWMRDTLRPLADELGWHPEPGESPSTKELRAAVHYTLGMSARDPETRARARQLADAYLSDPTAVDPSMLRTVLRVAAREGDAALYDRYAAALGAPASPEEASQLRRALARFDAPELRRRNFELALSGELRSQDTPDFWVSMINDRDSFDAVWEKLTASWDRALEGFPEPTHPFIVPFLGRGICDPATRDRFEAFAASVEVDHEPRTMAQTRERIANCLDLKQLHQDRLSAYLR